MWLKSKISRLQPGDLPSKEKLSKDKLSKPFKSLQFHIRSYLIRDTCPVMSCELLKTSTTRAFHT
jgi:hypothetical protein